MKAIIDFLKKIIKIAKLKKDNDPKEAEQVLERLIPVVEKYFELEKRFFDLLSEWDEVESAKEGDRVTKRQCRYYQLVQQDLQGITWNTDTLLRKYRNLLRALKENPGAIANTAFYKTLFDRYKVSVVRSFSTGPIKSFKDLINSGPFEHRLEHLEKFHTDFKPVLKYEEYELEILEAIKKIL